MNNFSGHVAIVTGAASGIGLAIAHKLLSMEAQVILFDLNEENLHAAFDQYETKVDIVGISVTEEEHVQAAIAAAIEKYKKIDILINCVGITGVTNIKSHEVESENLHKVMEVNFMSCFYTSKWVLPNMIQNKYGRILHIASIAGKEGNAGMLAYSASKAAVICMAKVQGSEYAEMGITVNALAPAVIQTPLVDAMPEVQVKYMTDKIPMKRCGTLEEAANMAAYIVSPQNSFTTGFTFDLSGGRARY
jgi:NAD(P)-dependent dehydrogenase (short-subunit alcohol dehydrogenase family)